MGQLHRNLLQYSFFFTIAAENKTLFLIVKHTSTNGFMWKYSILLVLTILSHSVFMSNTLLRIKIVFLNFNDFLLGRMVSTVVYHGWSDQYRFCLIYIWPEIYVFIGNWWILNPAYMVNEKIMRDLKQITKHFNIYPAAIYCMHLKPFAT